MVAMAGLNHRASRVRRSNGEQVRNKILKTFDKAVADIPDGATIEVDGNTGQVTVVDVPS